MKKIIKYALYKKVDDKYEYLDEVDNISMIDIDLDYGSYIMKEISNQKNEAYSLDLLELDYILFLKSVSKSGNTFILYNDAYLKHNFRMYQTGFG